MFRQYTRTGNIRTRVSLFGKMIVQIEESYETSFCPHGSPPIRYTRLRWRDAKRRDVGFFKYPDSQTIASRR